MANGTRIGPERKSRYASDRFSTHCGADTRIHGSVKEVRIDACERPVFQQLDGCRLPACWSSWASRPSAPSSRADHTVIITVANSRARGAPLVHGRNSMQMFRTFRSSSWVRLYIGEVGCTLDHAWGTTPFSDGRNRFGSRLQALVEVVVSLGPVRWPATPERRVERPDIALPARTRARSGIEAIGCPRREGHGLRRGRRHTPRRPSHGSAARCPTADQSRTVPIANGRWRARRRTARGCGQRRSYR